MASRGEFDLWTLLESEPEQGTGSAPLLGQPKRDQDKSPQERSRGRWFLDAAGALIWSYFIVKLFVADVDRALVERIAPAAIGLLDYRIFFYLGILVGVAWLLPRSRRWWVLYLAAFPAVVLLWKIPAFLYRRRSWPLAFVSLQALTGLFGDLRYHVLTKSLGLFAAVMILLNGWPPLVAASAACIAVLVGWGFARLVARTFSSSSFIEIQRQAILNLLSSRFLRAATALRDEYRRTDIQRYEPGDRQQVILAISLGIAVNRAVYLWAYQLDRYRRQYRPAVVFTTLTVLWLFLGVVVGLTLVNEAILKLDPRQFQAASTHPSLLAVALFSLSSLWLSSLGGLSAVGDLAVFVQFVAGLAGPVLVASFGFGVLAAIRRSRDDAATSALVADLKERAREHGKAFENEFAVTVEEARRRLEALGATFAFLFRYIAASVPADFTEEP